MAKTGHIQTRGRHISGYEEGTHGDRNGQLANSEVLHIPRINDSQKRRIQKRREEPSGKGTVEMERADWSDFQQSES